MKIFKSISVLQSHLKKTDKKLPFPIIDTAPDYESLELRGEGKMAIIPSLNKINSLYVYRGQNTRYKKCISSLLRGRVDQLDFIAYKVRMSEFENLLLNPRKILSDKIGLKQNIEGLAQHYGLKTFHLDVTQDLNVATFFACCKLDQDNNWVPMAEGTGVLYRSPMINIDLVGVQVYPRPKAQVAHSIIIGINQDYEKIPMVEVFEFQHIEKESEKILEYFDYGRVLFPYDPLDEKAKKIQDNNTFSIKSLRRVLKKEGISAKEISKKAKEVNSWFKKEKRGEFTNRNEYSFNKTEKRAINQSINELRASIIEPTGFRSAFSIKI